MLVPFIDNDDLGVELFFDASCDSVDPLFGDNQEPSNKVGYTLKKRRNIAHDDKNFKFVNGFKINLQIHNFCNVLYHKASFLFLKAYVTLSQT